MGTTLDVFVHGLVVVHSAGRIADCGGIAVRIHRVLQGEVEEVLEEVEFALGVVRALAVVDVNLARTVHILVVHKQVARVVHHGIEVVVVGHGELHEVGVGLAEVRLSVVGYVVVVLVPVHRREVVEVRNTVGVVFGIGLVGEHLPSAADDLEGTGCDVRLLQTHGAVGQHDGRLLQLADARHTALELQVDVDDMLLGNLLDVGTRLVALLVCVLVDDGNHLVLAEVVDVGLTRHVECRCADRHVTVDSEVDLLVGQRAIYTFTDDGTDSYLIASGVVYFIDVRKGKAFALGIDGVGLAAEVIDSRRRKCLLHDILFLIVVERFIDAFR